MRVLVGLRVMRRMFMVMAAMLSGMLMVMHMGIFGMSVLVRMLVQMHMSVRVRMLMRMDYLFMMMLMAVHMGMLMRVQMLVFVFSFHDRLPLKDSQFLTNPAPDGGFQVRRWGVKAPPDHGFLSGMKTPIRPATGLRHFRLTAVGRYAQAHRIPGYSK
jgi:hypothetical protein